MHCTHKHKFLIVLHYTLLQECFRLIEELITNKLRIESAVNCMHVRIGLLY